MMLFRARPWPFVAVFLLASACKKEGPSKETVAVPPVAEASNGWTAYEDEEFRLNIPSADAVKRSKLSVTNGSPTFSIEHKDSLKAGGTLSFHPYELDQRSELLIRDAAELELKDYIAGGGKTLVGVRVIPMRTGSCAVFTAVAGLDCREPNRDMCAQHHTLAYCDSPKKKRYLFIGDLGATGNVDQRPPGFAENAANFERILRSIEFKKS